MLQTVWFICCSTILVAVVNCEDSYGYQVDSYGYGYDPTWRSQNYETTALRRDATDIQGPIVSAMAISTLGMVGSDGLLTLFSKIK